MKFVLIALSMALFCTIQVSEGCCNNCHDGWVSYGENCYYFSTTETASWDDARKLCLKHGSDLASILTPEENSFLKDWAKRSSVFDVDGYWTGGNDQATEGTFVWGDGSTFSYSDWHAGEPNDLNNNEDCLELRKDFQFQWNDLDCSHLNAFICKKAC
uniref:Toxin candidate TRINITY_DN20625_c6_g6_i3.p1 n=1 Tax=Ceriantheomorphe brasiliensis TaxID=1048506 RepID=A0A7G7WYW4_9CNID|nr:toxin candidate TRINITY_DN20625_c6_g6_i3.p1 [Ceriantheomorphe brasiliensis]